MVHTQYYRVHANTHFELGVRLGELFKKSFFSRHESFLKSGVFEKEILIKSHDYLKITDQFFPLYIEELQGHAHGLGVDFETFWTLYLQDDIDMSVQKCTSSFSSDGLIIGHNEDNYACLSTRISILEKSLGGKSVLELHYHNSLGGDACSINSFGYVQTINTLHHIDHNIGVPRNIIARWLSETKDPQKDFNLMKNIPRSMGYSHTFGNSRGEVTNIESTAKESQCVKTTLPFVHTNHYLTSLLECENKKNSGNSVERCYVASGLVQKVKTAEDMMHLLEDVSNLASNDVRESKTIARMVFDLKQKEVWCYLANESSLGWVKYPISFL